MSVFVGVQSASAQSSGAITGFSAKDPHPITHAITLGWNASEKIDANLEVVCSPGTVRFQTDRGNKPTCEKGGIWSWTNEKSGSIIVYPSGNKTDIKVEFFLTKNGDPVSKAWRETVVIPKDLNSDRFDDVTPIVDSRDKTIDALQAQINELLAQIAKLKGGGQPVVIQPVKPVPVGQTVTEQVKCVFSGTNEVQKCYTAVDDQTFVLDTGCSGVGTCVVDVKAARGSSLTWKSSCGGYADTTVDGTNEYANFVCSDTVNTTDAPSMLKVITPSQGDVLQEGKTYKISWAKPVGVDFDFDYFQVMVGNNLLQDRMSLDGTPTAEIDKNTTSINYTFNLNDQTVDGWAKGKWPNSNGVRSNSEIRKNFFVIVDAVTPTHGAIELGRSGNFTIASANKTPDPSGDYSITLKTPTTGENWKYGESYHIKWKTKGKVGTKGVHLYDVNTYAPLYNLGEAKSNSLKYTVPSHIPAGKYILAVCAYNFCPPIGGSSSAIISIGGDNTHVDPTPTVPPFTCSANKVEIIGAKSDYAAGEVVKVSVKGCNDKGSLMTPNQGYLAGIRIQTKEGADSAVAHTGVIQYVNTVYNSSTGAYDATFAVPQTPDKTYKLIASIRCAGPYVGCRDTNENYESSYFFTVVKNNSVTSYKPLTLTWPNGGETLKKGETYKIKWEGGDPSWPIRFNIISSNLGVKVGGFATQSGNDGEQTLTMNFDIPGEYYFQIERAVGLNSYSNWPTNPDTSSWDYSNGLIKVTN